MAAEQSGTAALALSTADGPGVMVGRVCTLLDFYIKYLTIAG
jgi:hypothetical protein